MTVSDPGRRRVGFIVFTVLAAALVGCGGGNGGGGGGGSTPTTQVTNPGQSNTRTPTRPPTASATPTPSPTIDPHMQVVVPPGANVRAYVRRAPANATLILSPGTYPAVRLESGDVRGAISIYGDVEGVFSDLPAAEVVINAGIESAAMALHEVADVALDGLTFVGGTGAALSIVDSPGTIVTDCTIRRSNGHGAVFERSDDGLFFNNLVYDNVGTGLRVLGSGFLFAINNTMYGNRAHGVFVSRSAGEASSSLLLENSIINRNQPTGITIDLGPPSSLTGYFGDFNLNSDGYGPGTPAGDNDISGLGSLSDPQFTFPVGGDFHLSATSPALNAGDPETDPALVPFLTERTTRTDQTLDTLPLDLGYHYRPIPTPTPRL